MNNVAAGGVKPFRFASLRGAMEKRCDGQHNVYVAEVVYVEAEGKLVVVTVCRSCDAVRFHEQQIAQPHHSGILLKQKGNVNEL